MKGRYPISTLAEMARIPEEALPRFLAELPSILTTLRQVEASADALSAEARSKAPWWIRWAVTPTVIRGSIVRGGHMTWVDDDKGTATVRMRVSADSPDFYSRTETMGKSA